MPKVACYIDGFNLYHAIDALNNDRLKWLDLRLLAESFLRPGDTLQSVAYFTALMTWDQTKVNRHREYINALKAHNVDCIVSKFQRTKKHCQKNDRYCHFVEEKQTDVAFSARILSDCLTATPQAQIDRIILITADSDQVPTVAAIRGLKPNISILIACPPGRKAIAKELGYVAQDSREISAGRIEKCLFPRNVKDGNGKVVARSPAKYQSPRY